MKETKDIDRDCAPQSGVVDAAIKVHKALAFFVSFASLRFSFGE